MTTGSHNYPRKLGIPFSNASIVQSLDSVQFVWGRPIRSTLPSLSPMPTLTMASSAIQLWSTSPPLTLSIYQGASHLHPKPRSANSARSCIGEVRQLQQSLRYCFSSPSTSRLVDHHLACRFARRWQFITYEMLVASWFPLSLKARSVDNDLADLQPLSSPGL